MEEMLGIFRELSGVLIPVAPMLPEEPVPPQPPEPPVPTRAKRPRRDLKPKVGVTNPVTGEEQVVQAHKQPPVRAKHGRGRVRRK